MDNEEIKDKRNKTKKTWKSAPIPPPTTAATATAATETAATQKPKIPAIVIKDGRQWVGISCYPEVAKMAGITDRMIFDTKADLQSAQDILQSRELQYYNIEDQIRVINEILRGLSTCMDIQSISEDVARQGIVQTEDR